MNQQIQIIGRQWTLEVTLFFPPQIQNKLRMNESLVCCRNLQHVAEISRYQILVFGSKDKFYSQNQLIFYSPARCLKARVQPNKEWMIGGCLKHMFLCLYPINILIICDQFFLDDFHGVHTSCGLQLHHEYLGVAATPNHTQHLKILQADGRLTRIVGRLRRT